MIHRVAETRLKKLAASFRSVAVVGPRQSGKTTMCKMVFPGKPYISLENPDTLDFVTSDPRGFLAQYKTGAIIDEAQRAPHLFSYMQQVLDETKKRGLFILTGSNNFLMQQNISQTLAGRVAYLHLLPFSLDELKEINKLRKTFYHAAFSGGYPEVIIKKIDPADWYPAYLNTYIERDVRQLKNITNLSLFQKFLMLCAGRIGQLLNLNSLANDCGIDQKTATAWLTILQSSYIIYLLKPHHINFNKRVIKSPKLYFYDTGVACSLLGIKDAKTIITHAAKGSLFENLIILQLLKQRLNAGAKDNLHFWRDKTGNEVDVLLDDAGKYTALELKAGETIANDYFNGLNYFDKLQKDRITKKLIYAGKDKQKRSYGVEVIPWNEI